MLYIYRNSLSIDNFFYTFAYSLISFYVVYVLSMLEQLSLILMNRLLNIRLMLLLLYQVIKSLMLILFLYLSISMVLKTNDDVDILSVTLCDFICKKNEQIIDSKINIYNVLLSIYSCIYMYKTFVLFFFNFLCMHT